MPPPHGHGHGHGHGGGRRGGGFPGFYPPPWYYGGPTAEIVQTCPYDGLALSLAPDGSFICPQGHRFARP